MLRSFFIGLSTNKPFRKFSESSSIGRRVSHRFVAGMSIEEAIAAAQQLNREGIAVTLDALGGGCSLPIGVHCIPSTTGAGNWRMIAQVVSLDGESMIQTDTKATSTSPEAFGRCVADDLHEYLDAAPVSRYSRLMGTGAHPESLIRKLARQNAAELAALADAPPAEHIEAFAASARPIDELHRAVDRGPLLVAGEEKGDRTVERPRGRRSFVTADHASVEPGDVRMTTLQKGPGASSLAQGPAPGPGAAQSLEERRRPGAREQLLLRVAAEFNEMPGQKLTLSQAIRLFSLRDDICVRVLATLIRDGLLLRTSDELYAKRSSEPRIPDRCC